LSGLTYGTAAEAADTDRWRVTSPRFARALRAMRGIVWRELFKFFHQYGRMVSAIVRPALWLIVVAAGLQNLFGISPIEPYSTYIPFREYIVPGLIGMVLLFNGMQSSLSLVYDREVGIMRLLLMAPLPRWFVLLCKLIGGTILSVVQCYVFLGVAYAVGVYVPWTGWLIALPALLLSGFMLGSIGLLLSVYIRQLENFAGTMNFVIFPMFFLSSALYPLWRLREGGGDVLYWISAVNPFTHAVELARFAAYGQFNSTAFYVVAGTAIVCFLLAALAYDPQRGLIRRRGAA
jgi:ABC-2 type transport system permease protein